MNAPEAQRTLFDDLVAELPDRHRAEFFRNLHKAGISPNDVELAHPRSVLIQWRAQGVIQVSGGTKGKADKFTYPVRVGGKQVRMIKIVALDSVERKKSLRVFEERVKG